MGKSYESGSSACKLEISDELTMIIEKNINIGELNEERVERLLHLMKSWIEVMQKEIKIIKDFKSGRIQQSRAMEAYDFWDRVHTNFKTILEQLSTSKAVEKNVNIMEANSGSQVVSYTLRIFKEVKRKFEMKYDTEVKNTKHFMDSIYGGIDAIINAPFSAILENITPLYNNLNLMWLTSNLFSRKIHMERLLESISDSIADRVSQTLSIPDIFRYKISEALVLIKNALRVLDRWKAGYVKCKKDIGTLSTSYFSRWAWEFDEKILFGRLNFVRLIVDDLYKITEIIELKLLSPEVSYIFKDVRQTHVFIRQCIINVFFDLETDVYDGNRVQAWKGLMDRFLLCFENSVYDKIVESIRTSTSAADDFRALEFFEDMMIRDKLAKRLRPEYAVVLEKFVAEIDGFHAQLESLKSSPRLMTNVTPAAGHIIFVRDLYMRAKKTARVVEPLTQIQPVQKNKALSLYANFCEEIFAHENRVFSEWLRVATEVEGRHLQESLLIFRGNKLVSTFDNELFHVIDTALQLHLLGFDLPQVLINLVNRQKQIKYNVMKINELVRKYNEIVDKMDPPIAKAMDGYFAKIKSSLRPGLEKRCTYLSAKLIAFINNCLDSFRVFNRIYSEIKSYETTISEKLETIENLTFFSIDFDDGIQDFFNTFERFKKQGNENASVITSAMTYVAEALDLIEITCYGVQTGHHEQMSLFYEKYENALHDTFITMVSNNFRTLKAVVDGDRAAFLIRGQLVDGRFALVPNINAAINAIARAMDDVLNRLKSVPRWLAGTNVRCPIVQRSDAAAGGDHRLPYSFYDRALVDSTHLIDAEKRCYDSVEKIGDLLDDTAQKFARFSFLFDEEDGSVTSLFAKTEPTLKDYGDRLEFFSTLSNELRSQSHLDLGCVRIDYSEFNDRLLERCVFWHSLYGERLLLECAQTMAAFTDRISTLKTQLKTHFQNCQGLDVVEKSIKEIKEAVFHADSIFQDMHNRFYFLKQHKITIPKHILNQLEELKTNWQNVYKEALAKSVCFEDAKASLLRTST